MLVSIIIPCFNVEKYIPGCIESVLAQSHKDIEVILVDNNSSDRTFSILRNYQIKYPLKISIYQESRQGAPFARNHGLEHANGKWIQFLDADDRLFPDKILNQLQDFPDVDLILSPYYEKLANDTLIENNLYTKIWSALANGKAGITSSLLFKNSFFSRGGKWNDSQTNHQEYDLMWQWIKKGARYAFSNKKETLKVERKQGSISIDQIENFPIEGIRIIQEIRQYLNEKDKTIISQYDLDTQAHLFYLIRCLYKTDKQKALHIHKNCTFTPAHLYRQRSSYRLVYNLFGFEAAEKMLGKLRKTLA